MEWNTEPVARLPDSTQLRFWLGDEWMFRRDAEVQGNPAQSMSTLSGISVSSWCGAVGALAADKSCAFVSVRKDGNLVSMNY